MKIHFFTKFYSSFLLFVAVLSLCKCNYSQNTNSISNNTVIEKQESLVLQYAAQIIGDSLIIISNNDKSISVTMEVAGNTITKTIQKPYKVNILNGIKSIPDNKYEIALLATKNNNTIPLRILISGYLDTTINYSLKPISYTQPKTTIKGKCAPLILKSSDNNLITDTKRWLFKKKEPLADPMVINMINILRALDTNVFEDYITNTTIPVVNTLSEERYTISSDMVASHYALFAFTSQEEIDKFVEDVVSNNFISSTSSLNTPLLCQSNGNGCKCIALIGINNDWSYDVIPLGLIVIDDIAPTTRTIDYSSNTNMEILQGYNPYSYSALEEDFNKKFTKDDSNVSTDKVITIDKNRRIHINNIPTIDGDVKIKAANMDGNGLKCSITFIITHSGDAKSVTIIREYAPGEYSTWSSYPKPERKTILLKDKESKFKIVYDYHLTDGDNLIPMIVEDYHGNKKQVEINVPVSFEYRGGNDINIDIDNTINNSIYNY